MMISLNLVCKVFAFILCLVSCSSSDSGFRDVKVKNGYDDVAISVYWQDQSRPDEPGVFMYDLEALQTTTMNTVTGHSFYAEFKDKKKATAAGYTAARCTPLLISIEPSPKDFYAFGSSPGSVSPPALSKTPQVASHPLIKIIGQPTTAMSAIFRCLAPKVDYYFDDGRDGSYQGTLELGKETTSATYEGHVFFFVEHGNKKNELARFVMKKDQVIQRNQMQMIFIL